MAPIRLIIADDHPVFRSGLRTHLEKVPDIDLLAEAATGNEALRLAQTLNPDVMLLDLEMPGLSGIEITQRLRDQKSAIHVLILSAFEDEDYIFGVLDVGAAGYLTKQEPLDLILEAIRGVARGETGWLSRRIAALFVDRHRTRKRPGKASLRGLSEREREVLHLLALGHTNEKIGARLFISESTVKKHVNSIYVKIGVNTRAQAVAWVWKNDLVEYEEDEDING